MGSSYFSGRGVEKDLKEAVIWYRKIGRSGLRGSSNKLGDCYCMGQGVEKDSAEAEKMVPEKQRKKEMHIVSLSLASVMPKANVSRKMIQKLLHGTANRQIRGSAAAQFELRQMLLLWPRCCEKRY